MDVSCSQVKRKATYLLDRSHRTIAFSAKVCDGNCWIAVHMADTPSSCFQAGAKKALNFDAAGGVKLSACRMEVTLNSQK